MAALSTAQDSAFADPHSVPHEDGASTEMIKNPMTADGTPPSTSPASIGDESTIVLQPSLPPPPPPAAPLPVVGIAEAINVTAKPYDNRRNRFRHDECRELEEESVEDNYSILLQTLFLVCIIVAAKILMRRYIPWKGETELSEISLVFTGLFFIMGQMFSAVNSDLKETEKMPMDVVSSLDQMEDSFVLASAKVADKVNLLDSQHLMTEFARVWRDSVLKQNNKSYGDCLNILADIVDLAREWDKKGAANTAPILVIVDKVRRVIARATVIKRTDVLPAARALLNFFIMMSCVLMFLASYKTEVGLAVVMACVITVCIFMGRIIQAMDDPFNIVSTSRARKWLMGHMACVRLFPLYEYILRMERKIEKQFEELRSEQMKKAQILAIDNKLN